MRVYRAMRWHVDDFYHGLKDASPPLSRCLAPTLRFRAAGDGRIIAAFDFDGRRRRRRQAGAASYRRAELLGETRADARLSAIAPDARAAVRRPAAAGRQSSVSITSPRRWRGKLVASP